MLKDKMKHNKTYHKVTNLWNKAKRYTCYALINGVEKQILIKTHTHSNTNLNFNNNMLYVCTAIQCNMIYIYVTLQIWDRKPVVRELKYAS